MGVQQERDRQPLADLGEHGLAVGQERAAEVEMHHPRQPAPVLHGHRLVESEFLDQPLLDLRRGVRVLGREEIERAAGGQADDEEGDEGDADEQGDGEEEPAEREQEHRGESKGRPS